MRYSIIALLVLFCFVSCDVIQDIIIKDSAEYRIVTRSVGTTSTGRPKVSIIIKNIGDGIGYNVSCDIQAKRGNTIVGSGFAYFAGGGDIEPGEQAQDEAIFWGLSTIEDCQLKYQLSWLER